MEVRQSEFCCGVYELGNLTVPEETEDHDHTGRSIRGYECESSGVIHRTQKAWWDRVIKDALESASSQGSPRVPPPAIWFADGDKFGNGTAWCRELRKRGYTVKRHPIGRNPKSGNDITAYLWFTGK